MDCPKCGFALDAAATECPRCGIVLAKFLRRQELGARERPPWSGEADALAGEPPPEVAARRERMVRTIALPLALLFAWLAVKQSPEAVRLLAMWVHESGHAVTAWACGYLAWPGPWFTPVGMNRTPVFSLLLVGLVAYGGYRAWQLRRWFWIAASAAGIMLVFGGTMVLSPSAAQQLIIFGGDGGSLVLGTLLMLTVYAREAHPVRRNHLRWGLVAIGALAFMDAYVVWTGPIAGLPLGENENGLSDATVLTEQHGWPLLTLVARYGQLAHACLGLLAVAYLAALAAQILSPQPSRGFSEEPQRPAW